jgi:hypothetical protein
MAPRKITVGDIISEHRRSYPGKLALADGERHLTWPELDERVNRLANALRRAGVGPGDRVLWLGQNSFRVYELLGAAAKIGAMVCPGYWRWAAPEMTFAIEDFSPKVVIWQEEEIGSTVRAARAACPAAESALWLRHDSDPAHGYEAFLAGGDPADPGLDIGNFQFFGIPVLIQGGTNVVTRRVIAGEVLDILAAEKCTRAYIMPATITGLVELMRERGVELPHLRATTRPRCGRAWWRRTTAATAAKAAAWATATGRPRSPGSACTAGTAAGARATPAVLRRSPRSGSSATRGNSRQRNAPSRSRWSRTTGPGDGSGTIRRRRGMRGAECRSSC